jgi:peroxiredoxin
MLFTGHTDVRGFVRNVKGHAGSLRPHCRHSKAFPDGLRDRQIGGEDVLSMSLIAPEAVGACWPRKRLMLVLMVAGFLASGLGAAVSATEAERESAALSSIAGPPRPSFALPTLDGPIHDLARNRGQVVLVHFFATWCEPCIPELASLRALQDRLAGRPFKIVAISVAEADSAVRRFFAREPSTFSILLDRDRSIARAWGVQTLPSTVVLDHRSQARFLAEGDVNWARADVMGTLAALLEDTPDQRDAGGG